VTFLATLARLRLLFSRRAAETGVLARATWQLAVGVAIGLLVSLVLERYSGGEMMGGRALVVVPGIAAFMAVVGLLAAAGPARRGLRVQPIEVIRAE
jgi:ABC-type lipoprotein release transport system permease subunit